MGSDPIFGAIDDNAEPKEKWGLTPSELAGGMGSDPISRQRPQELALSLIAGSNDVLRRWCPFRQESLLT